MNGATSPTGESHPGTVVTEDHIDGRTWTDPAAELPQTLAWVQLDDVWVAVTRIEVTGLPDRRRFTKFDADGNVLETTVMAPPPPRSADEGPVPTPTPQE